jgi:hypothetical protein
MRAIVEGGEVIESLRERILGRSAAEDVINPETREVVVQAARCWTKTRSTSWKRLASMKCACAPR